MGGYGSGGYRWGKRRATVEGCYHFDCKMLAPLFSARPNETRITYWLWSDSRSDEMRGIISYTNAGSSSISLTIVRDEKREEQTIPISTTPCRFGGVRYWLHCPRCGRRVFRLYLYPHIFYSGTNLRVNRFACRLCYGLTYHLWREKDPYHVAMLRGAD